MKRILITGIEGFVGGHLCRHLSAAGMTVIGLHWAEVTTQLPAELHRGNICDYDKVKELLSATKPDAIIHLGGISSVATSESHTLRTYEVNAFGTIKLLEAVRQLNLHCRVVLVSSADVYGRSNVGEPLAEDTAPLPLSPYALSKLFTGEVGRFYHRAYGTDVVVLRPFSHTGPGQAPLFVFPKVAHGIARIERGEAPPIIEMGDLEVRRDYTDVRDVVRAYALALDRCQSGESYNVTSGCPIVIREGVDYLCSLARRPVEIRSIATHFRAHDIPLLTGDPTKFKAATGWEPQIPFRRTLTDLLDYYRAQTG